MTKFTCENGAEVEIKLASWGETTQLKDSIEQALIKKGFSIGDIKIESLEVEAMGQLLQAIMMVDSDPEVRNSIFKCLARCLYNGERITQDTFEPLEARENYYEIVIACIKENLSPLVKRLFSKFKTLADEKGLIQNTKQS